MTEQPWSRARPPTLADMEALADAAYAALPKQFTRLCEGLVIRVEDFPDDETLDDMRCESEFDLLGLFRGRGLTQGAHLSETGEQPNMIWLLWKYMGHGRVKPATYDGLVWLGKYWAWFPSPQVYLAELFNDK